MCMVVEGGSSEEFCRQLFATCNSASAREIDFFRLCTKAFTASKVKAITVTGHEGP
jgi:hypothetical protein